LVIREAQQLLCFSGTHEATVVGFNSDRFYSNLNQCGQMQERGLAMFVGVGDSGKAVG
jgi:hypothetical protein